MIILYMFCALFVVRYSANIMQSVNIHIIKIFNKTCRWLIKILNLICTFSKLFDFFSIFLFFFFEFFFSPRKTANTSMRSLGDLEVTSLSPRYCIHNSSRTMCNSFAFSKARFFFLNEMMCKFQSNDSSSKWQNGQNTSGG